MADVCPNHHRHSWVHFCPISLPEASDRSGYFEPRRYRRGSICIKSVLEGYDHDPISNADKFRSHFCCRLTRTLSTSTTHAKRLIRLIVSARPASTRSPSDASDSSAYSLGSATTEGGKRSPFFGNMRANIRGSIGGPVSGMISRSSLTDDVRAATEAAARAQHMNTIMPGTDPNDKPLVSGSGVNVSINLAEPALFLQGFEQNDMASGNTAMLRGTLHLRVTKAAKIKAVTLKFKGRATTKWPEGDFPQYFPVRDVRLTTPRYSST
jgi:hypothetical protein